jgi:excisionase family DNA binding protein
LAARGEKVSTARLKLSRPSDSEKLLTVPEIAALLRVKPATIYVWVSKRLIPYRKVGHLTRFDRDEILRWTLPETK